VRGIHAQDRKVARARGGQRVGLNLIGLDGAGLRRGDWLSEPGAIAAGDRVDARLRLLRDLPFLPRHLGQVKVYIGAKTLAAKLFVLRDGPGGRLLPGEESLVQLMLESPVQCCRGDRFLIRDYGETEILGGGEVLDPLGVRAGRTDLLLLEFILANPTTV